MAEKRGHTNKIVYDFDTGKMCEVKIKGNYYRTTPNEFRSFGGNRRLQGESYSGNVYYVGTNKIVPENMRQPKIHCLSDIDPRPFGRRRPNEKFHV